MTRVIMLVSPQKDIYRESTQLGILKAFKENNINIGRFNPIIDNFYQNNSSIIRIPKVELLFNDTKLDILVENIITQFNNIKKNKEIIFLENFSNTNNYSLLDFFNKKIGNILNAEVILYLSINKISLDIIKEYINTIIDSLNIHNKIIGIILHELNLFQDYNNYFDLFNNNNFDIREFSKLQEIFNDIKFPIICYIPGNENNNLLSIYAKDIADYLKASFLQKKEIYYNKIKYLEFCENSLSNNITPYSLIITYANNYEIISDLCNKNLKIGALLLTNSENIDNKCKKLLVLACNLEIPIFTVKDNIWKILKKLHKFSISNLPYNTLTINNITNYICYNINISWIKSFKKYKKNIISNNLSPERFCYQLIESARKVNKCIVLPEGNEPRIIKAASICAERGIAKFKILGDPKEIKNIVRSHKISLHKNIEIIHPSLLYDRYINRFIELRSSKGMTDILAKKQIKNNIILATLMLEQGDVDGLVAGAINTTANTIRPSLQLIKNNLNNLFISSVFFMLFKNRVFIFGDCAINPNPSVEQLAEIAIQSANTAQMFGITPYIAMISYSTGDSGSGEDVEKVKKATSLVRKKCSHLIIDGPLQYDAAIIPHVAKLKAPTSIVAGKANTFIFPDLNSGNSTYKAVQHAANIISIGPILQGMLKPVNDLSRSATINDIVYTITITVIQSNKI